jgi:formylglycine-generating enzyme required for sulfatase activity
MHSNVWEWCEDEWHPNDIGAPRGGSAWGGGNTSLRVLRGGSMSNPNSAPSLRRGATSQDSP